METQHALDEMQTEFLCIYIYIYVLCIAILVLKGSKQCPLVPLVGWKQIKALRSEEGIVMAS
jgi:hypothetical protein